ncbi:MAG: pirin family protein [Phycisphaeraceae bacterium]
MITPRPSASRGHFDYGWLDTHHTFAFGRYYDPRYEGFRSLRVLNEDRVAGGKGFDTHGHQDMEIVTIVLEGALEHKDSLGTSSVIRVGEVQRMSAGTGVRHSEFNPSLDEPVHLLQVWIEPEQVGLAPGYEQKAFTSESKHNRLCEVASSSGRHGAVTIQQDAAIYVASLDAGKEVEHDLGDGRAAYVQVTRGAILLNGQKLTAGDGAAVENETRLTLRGDNGGGEVLLFDLA